MQVYRYLDVGSGKPSLEEQKSVVHHLIDIVDPDYSFTAGEFCREALKACDEIRGKGKIPLIVGGTGLYLDSFFQGLSDIPDIDPVVKALIQADLEKNGIDELYRELSVCDPVFASRIHPHDRQRILRGLEVFRCLGKPISGFYGTKRGYDSESTLYIGLERDREELRGVIDHRVVSMMEAGFVDEVSTLRERGFGPELNSMRSIGYLRINEYLDGIRGLDETVELIKTDTKKYAKRQMTWFRKNKRIRWFHPEEGGTLKQIIEEWSMSY